MNKIYNRINTFSLFFHAVILLSFLIWGLGFSRRNLKIFCLHKFLVLLSKSCESKNKKPILFHKEQEKLGAKITNAKQRTCNEEM